MKKFDRSLYYLHNTRHKCGSRIRRIKDNRCIRCQSLSNKSLYNKDYHAAYRAANSQYIRDYQRNYYRPKHKARNSLNARRLRERTFGCKDAIREFYLNCPKGYTVDHIVPLNGKNVSGLHCIQNLQYLTISENRSKNNKYII